MAVRFLGDPGSFDNTLDQAGALLALGALALFEGASADPDDKRTLRRVVDARMAAGVMDTAGH